MPRFDGTGPLGMGPGTGRGLGPCGAGRAFGRGFGMGRFCPYLGRARNLTKEEQLSALEAEEKNLEEELEEVRKEKKSLK